MCRCKPTLAGSLFLVVFLVVAGCTAESTKEIPADAEQGHRQGEIRWELASIMPAGTYIADLTGVFADRVRQSTGGDVTISVHLAGTLGLKGPEMLNAVRDGLVHLADIQMNQQVGEDVLFGIESTACLATDFEELSELQKLTRPLFEALAADYNQKILYIYPVPRQVLFANRATDTSLNQYAGLGVRTIDRNGVEFFRRLGAVPRQMPWPDVLAALSTHALDAVSTSGMTAVAGSFWEFLGHATLLHWQMNSFMVTVNLDAWKQLSEDHRRAIEAVSRDMEARLWQASRGSESESLAILREHGMTIVAPGVTLRREIEAVCQDIRQDTLATQNREAVDLIRQYRSTTDR